MRKRSIIQMVLIGVAAGIATGAVAYFIPWLPDPASSEAGPIDRVYWVTTIICVGIFAVVAGVSVYAGLKFRARPDDPEDGSPIHGHTGLEIFWTAVPFALVLAISVYSGLVLTQIEDIPDDHRTVEVTAQQFAWSFKLPELEPAQGQLVLRVNEPVELLLTSRDVIHSFWVPEFRMKQDAVPGVTTRTVVTPTRTGRFAVVCTELCGLGHAAMRAEALVLGEAEFDEWVAQQEEGAQAAGGAADGKELFASLGCGSCHALADAGTTGQVGPDLDEVLPDRSDDEIRESIVDPNAQITEGFQPGVMPDNYDEQLSDEQLEALVEYLVDATKGG